ncbi:MAG: carbohydrate ABC transporter permease [Treponema sp.]|jgi:multiple sugar transport system permease protein/putative aldouronate transport system permease protein|nr:carbohydrate ABC transporter permease [Treponema sp.]
MVKKKYGLDYINPVLNITNIFILGIFAFVCIYPLYYVFINSLSSSAAITNGVYFLPEELTFDAYQNLSEISGIGSAILVSIARTVIGALVTTLCSSFVSYIITRRQMILKKFIYRFIIFTMYINAGFIPMYLLIARLGLRNNFLVYILPYAVSAYYIILIKTYIESMAASVWESAEIDGAGILAIYFRIIVPLAQPILACIIIFAAVNQWNTWADDFFYMLGGKARNLHCLQYLLYLNLRSQSISMVNGSFSGASVQVTPTTLKMAMTFITVLPILLVYPYMQRYFTKGIMLGAVKG